MQTHPALAPRGISSAVPIVIMTVVFFLIALGAWMWYDMNRNDLEAKAKTYAELKKKGGTIEQVYPVGISPTVPAFVESSQENVFECRRAVAPVSIDGTANDPAWRDAQVIENFAQPWRGPGHPAKSKTRARLLWDDQYLYFLAEMDDTDVYSDIAEHNGDLWYNDVFELFFKPSASLPGYYEFEINAKNATLDLFFPSRGSGSVRRWAKVFQFHLDTKVALRGASTLNNHLDRDTGWLAEGRIPWSDFSMTGGKPKSGEEWKFALCRVDFSVDYDEPELSSCAPLKQQNFHRHEDYAVLKFK